MWPGGPGFVYPWNFDPISGQLPGQPSPGSVVLDFLALGKWIRLTDSGRGQLSGNPGEGSGTINYATGSIAVTLGALPDVDSALLVAWGTDLRARNSSAEVTPPTPTLRQQLDHPGVTPGTLVMTWTSGAASKTASADATGVITGDAAGQIDHTAGIVEFTTSALPDSGEQFHYAYDYVDPSKRHQETFTPTPAGEVISITLAHPPAENTVTARWTTTNVNGVLSASYVVADDGAGGWVGNVVTGTNTINYSTGAIVLTVE
jgi:hypothetical protein